MSDVVAVSFCTTCMGRLHHLRETLPKNLQAADGFPAVEFVLLDYSSPDGLLDWAQTELRSYVETGRLTYYHLPGRSLFNMNHARNVAHALARGSTVCSLDSDNFVSPGYIADLIALFDRGEEVVAHGRHTCWGRIAIARRNLVRLGGYDETFEGWGGDDLDLLERAKQGLGLQWVDMSRYDDAIHHGDADRTNNYRTKELNVTRKRNRRRMRGNLAAGRFVANQGRPWGKAIVHRNFEQEPIAVQGAPSPQPT